jgi:hypothetical protein
MKVNTDFTKILPKETEEKWVAFSEDRTRVIDSAENLPELRQRLGEKKDDYIYMKVLRSDMEYSF